MRNIIVVDLNVFVRGLLTSGVDRIIYRAVTEERIIPAFSPDMLENLARVLFRPRLKLKPQDIKSFMEALNQKAVFVKPTVKITACRDSSDNVILETAVASNAKIIVSNDKDLLVLNPFQGISILNSRKFLEGLK